MTRKLNRIPEKVLHKCKVRINRKINPDDIPTLIPIKALKEIQKNDPDPYYVIEEIKDITKPANRVIFSKEFWNGYLNEMKSRPIPGSKSGHEISSYKRPATDLYLIGGKIEGKKVFLKNYIPPKGDGTDNERFIQDCKIGIVHFSIVAYTEDERNDETGEITAVRYSHGARNDAVEYGTGAMKQKINIDKLYESGIKYAPFPNEHAARVRNPGDFQEGSFRRIKLPKSPGGKGGVSVIIGRLKGKTTTTAQSYRFPIKLYTVAEAKQWLKDNNIKYILFEPATKSEKQNTGGKYKMPNDIYKEIIENLNTQIENGKVSKINIAKDLKIEILTKENQADLKILSDIKELIGDDPLKEIKQMKSDREQVELDKYNNLREKLMSEKFGTEKIKRNGKDEINLVRQAAEPHVSKKIISEEELKKQIEEANENLVVKQLSKQMADYTSDINNVSGIVDDLFINNDSDEPDIIEM